MTNDKPWRISQAWEGLALKTSQEGMRVKMGLKYLCNTLFKSEKTLSILKQGGAGEYY